MEFARLRAHQSGAAESLNTMRTLITTFLLLPLSLGLSMAWADRPFLATKSAAAEEDDYRTWSISSSLQQDKWSRGLALSAEYAFEPRLSVEFGLQHTRPRLSGLERSTEAEVELKWLYNSIARDGWGIGVSLGLGTGKEDGERWRHGHWQVVIPFSLELSEKLLLHVNAGLFRERGERRERHLALAGEWKVNTRWTAFAELAQRGEEKLVHTGLRWWLKREKQALDLSVTQRQVDGLPRARGVVLNFSLYDL